MERVCSLDSRSICDNKNIFQASLYISRETKKNDTWLAATTSLGLLGVIARVKMEVVADFKVYADQTILDESTVLDGDIYAQISPYVTANYWVCASGPFSTHTKNIITHYYSGGLVREIQS